MNINYSLFVLKDICNNSVTNSALAFVVDLLTAIMMK